jgi:hypothetical protein
VRKEEPHGEWRTNVRLWESWNLSVIGEDGERRHLPRQHHRRNEDQEQRVPTGHRSRARLYATSDDDATAPMTDKTLITSVFIRYIPNGTSHRRPPKLPHISVFGIQTGGIAKTSASAFKLVLGASKRAGKRTALTPATSRERALSK